METNSTTKMAMKPILLKAGIPLAISVAGLILARISTRRYYYFVPRDLPSSQNPVDHHDIDSNEMSGDEDESFQSLESSFLQAHDAATMDSTETLGIQPCFDLKGEILSLRNRVIDLQEGERQLETRFIRYQDLKERELTVMDMQNKLVLEMNKTEFLGKEISLLEAENQRFGNLVTEYLNTLDLLLLTRQENGLLRRKVKKLFGKIKKHSLVIRRQDSRFEAKEAEVLGLRKEMEGKNERMRKMENEMEEMSRAMGRLVEEKNVVLSKLGSVEEADAALKVEGEIAVKIEDYHHLASELEQLQQDHTNKAKELIYLKWCNACLRHQLLRKTNHGAEEDYQQIEQNNKHLEESHFEGTEFGSDHEHEFSLISTSAHGESCFGFTAGGARNRVRSKRQKMVARFKRWVDGIEKGTKNNYEGVRGRERHSCGSYKELQIHARKSCSSA